MLPRLRILLRLCLLFIGAAGFAAVPSPLTFTVTPAATGEQLVRTSLPFPAGLLATDATIRVRPTGGTLRPAALRPLSCHPTRSNGHPSLRRGMVTFPFRFQDLNPVTFEVQASRPSRATRRKLPDPYEPGFASVLLLRWADGSSAELRLVAPAIANPHNIEVEAIEENAFFQWHRIRYPDAIWPRVVDVRSDCLGTIAVVGFIQNRTTNEIFAPEFGWDVQFRNVPRPAGFQPLSFTNGTEAFTTLTDHLAIHHPLAPLNGRGGIDVEAGPQDEWTYRYRRSLLSEHVPMQRASWRRAEIVFQRPGTARLTPTLSQPHVVEVSSRIWAELYHMPPAPSGVPPEIDALLRYHRHAVTHSAAIGDDFGNITGFNHGQLHGGIFGMNRLNHGAAIFEDGWRHNDRRLREAAVAWCNNFHDLSIWWGTKEPGGTRYNNIVAMDRTPPTRDFMWRSDSSVNFCTKGYDCFWLAWEETGDPRMREALASQTGYAYQHVHATVECRNIGDVRDFIRLYEFTGERQHLDEALRLFRELRTKLSTGNLFDQGGKPIDPDPPFINDDQLGLRIGYAKPYILGYALNGLPDLLRHAPDEPELRNTIRAVADFLASSVDPAGGWRYPHPRSTDTLISQGIEHAWQLTQAARVLGPEPRWLDTIETVLRARIHVWKRTNRILSGLNPWELASGTVKDRKDIAELYRKPADRDPSRDYTEGKISTGSAPPEGVVYFGDVLAFYLQHRPVERLLAEPRPEEPLGQILARLRRP
jgi:hypothetical protein